ncbi:DUF4097 domain-containing protein [Candidatus Babeliales bacterium]|nr:DUF4097 domain-containing protein [Candidatus Babeliales bacterium]
MKRTLIIIGLLGHCTPINSFWESFSFFTTEKEEIISLDKKVPTDCSITIKNKKGNIFVKTWNKHKVVVEACKKGIEKTLKNALIELTVHQNNVTLATTNIDDQETCSINYTVLIPAQVKTLSLHTEKGNISAENISGQVIANTEKGNINLININGTLKTTTEKGNISFSTKNLDSHHSILAITQKGNVSIALPEKTSATVQATTHKGVITSEHTVTTQPRTMKINKHTAAQLNKELFCTIGSGGPSLKIHTGKGTIDFIIS